MEIRAQSSLGAALCVPMCVACTALHGDQYKTDHGGLVLP